MAEALSSAEEVVLSAMEFASDIILSASIRTLLALRTSSGITTFISPKISLISDTSTILLSELPPNFGRGLSSMRSCSCIMISNMRMLNSGLFSMFAQPFFYGIYVYIGNESLYVTVERSNFAHYG